MKKMLEGAEVRLETDYFSDRDAFDAMAEKCVFTGMMTSILISVLASWNIAVEI